MKHLIIGTAGHVDHGKTALIRALTGQDTDRLPEEKARGISIDLGFADFRLPSGRRASIIDVPGHERFIRNMLAGITGIDLVLLVVAADEGVMPQTREHLDILSLLGIRQGAVVLTKVDLVDAELLDLVREDVALAVKGTFLEGAPVVPVSSVTGEGLDRLVEVVDRLLEVTEPKDVHSFARMPVDQAFVRPGFGTVARGTLVSGRIRVGDRLELLPQGVPVRVRGLQVHGEAVEVAEAGQRVGVNLSGVERAEVRRGDVLAAPGVLQPTDRFAGRLQLLASWPKALKHGTRVHLHTGASEVVGRVLLLDRDELEPGDVAYVQFRSESPLVVGRGDRFIIRSYSPVHTMGGGSVIEPHARYRRHDPAHLEELRVKETGGRAGVLAQTLAGQGPVPLLESELARLTGTPAETLAPDLRELEQRGEILRLEGGAWLHREGYRAFVEGTRRALADFYRQHPLRPGIPKEEVRRKVAPRADARAFAAVLARAVAAGDLALDRDRIGLPGRVVRLSPEQERLAGKLEAAVLEAGFAPPSVTELRTRFPHPETEEVILHLQETGKVVRLPGDLILHGEHLRAARERTREFLRTHATLTVADFRDLLGTTRKYALPILDYFDTERWTRRVGDERVAGPLL